MEVRGFKAFKSDLTNKYGAIFEVGCVYSKDPDTLKFGVNGHGYHMTAKLADTFRFFNPTFDSVYCEVIGSGKIVETYDNFYNCDVMYVAEKMQIVKILTREDILQYAYEADLDEIRRFLALFPFTKEELEVLRLKIMNRETSWDQVFADAVNQNGDICTFKRDRKYLRRIS